MNILLQSKALKVSRPQSRLNLSPWAVLYLRDDSVSLWLSCATSGGGGWGVLFSQTISYSDFITPETLMTSYFCRDQRTGLDDSFSPPVLTADVALHTKLPTLSPQITLSTLHGEGIISCSVPLAWHCLSPDSGHVTEPHTCRSLTSQLFCP